MELEIPGQGRWEQHWIWTLHSLNSNYGVSIRNDTLSHVIYIFMITDQTDNRAIEERVEELLRENTRIHI